jgi:hypothetical protein
LKQYDFRFHPLKEVEVLVQVQHTPLGDGEESYVDEIFSLGENIYRPIIDGYREGDDAHDVYADAIKWWDTQLSEIRAAF